MKKITSLRLFLCTVLMALTAGTVKAQETSTLTFEAKCNGSGTADDGVAWTVASDGEESNFDSAKGIHYGTSSKKVQYITLSTAEISGTITKVVVNASTASGVTATVGVTVGGATFGGDAQSLTASAANYTFEDSAEGEIIVTVTKPSNAAKALYVKSVAVTYTTGSGTDNRTATSITIDDSGITNTNVFTGTVAGSLAATVVAGEATLTNADITWSSEKPSVATIDNNGAITLVAAGSTVITAAFAGDNSYKPSTKTYTLTVTNDDPNGPGTVNNPYTVAQARAAIDAGTGVTGVYATGIVSEIVTPYSSYGNITYNISADGSTTGDQLQAYRGKSFNGNNFTSEDDIQVGATVVIYGNLKLYAATSTYEFDTNNQLVSYVAPVVAVEKPTFDVPAGTYTEAQTVTISAEAGTDIYYTTDGTAPTVNSNYYDAPVQITTTTTLKAIAVDAQNNESFVASAEYVIKPVAPTFSEDSKDFSAAFDLVITGANANGMVVYTTDGTDPVYAATGTNGNIYNAAINISATTTVKAIFVDQYENVSDITSATYTLVDANSVKATFPYNDSDFRTAKSLDNASSITGITVGNVTMHGTKGTHNTSYPSYYNNGDAVRVYTGNTLTVFSTNGNPLTQVSFTLTQGALSLADGQKGTYSDGTWTADASEEVVSVTFTNAAAAQARFTTATVTTKSDVTVTGNVSISSAGFGTLYTEQPFEVPAGMTAGIISAATAADADGIATLTIDWSYPEGTVVPAATPLLIKGAKGTYDYTCKGTTEATPADNLLHGSAVATTTTGGANDVFYMLSYGKDEKANVLGFFYGAPNGGAFESAAGKCWLAVAASSGIRGFVFGGDDDITTGISAVRTAIANGQAVYDLQGRRVENASRGVYIIGGKKVMVK